MTQAPTLKRIKKGPPPLDCFVTFSVIAKKFINKFSCKPGAWNFATFLIGPTVNQSFVHRAYSKNKLYWAPALLSTGLTPIHGIDRVSATRLNSASVIFIF